LYTTQSGIGLHSRKPP